MTKQTKAPIKQLSAFLSDLYKFGHKELYPKDTTYVYSTLTPRNNSYFPYSNKMVVFGYEMFVQKWLVEHYHTNFFSLPLEEVVADYQYVLGTALGEAHADASHIKALHKLGHLPVRIKALPEGTRVPMGVPVLTIESTHKDFAWLSNFLETLLLSETFPTATVASMAFEFKKLATRYATMTCDNEFHIPYQCHDFSERGQHSNGAAELSGIGHLTSFVGSDTLQAVIPAHNYYNADLAGDNILKSVVASEHSVMQSYTRDGEFGAYEDLLDRVPSGILSLVSDTYDYYNVLTEFLPKLKDKIKSRDGKLVIRPDSGTPIDVIAGKEIIDLTNHTESKEEMVNWINIKLGELELDQYDVLYSDENFLFKMEKTDEGNVFKHHEATPEEIGSLQLLWNTFGGEVNEKGYRVLDSHIGLLFGEGITVETMDAILARMERKGFASSNVVFGVGAYVYSVMISRDSFGQAIKSQMATVNGEERITFKEPKTDTRKKSLKGKVVVTLSNEGEYQVTDNLSTEQHEVAMKEKTDYLETIFENGERTRYTDFKDIRQRLEDYLPR